jgi:hypothetical protein
MLCHVVNSHEEHIATQQYAHKNKRPNIQNYAFKFNGKAQCALLAQARTFDGCRMLQKMGKLGESEFQSVKNALKKVLKI